MALGVQSGNNLSQSLAEMWTAGAWHVERVHSPAGGTQFTDLACATPASCWGLGSIGPISNVTWLYLARWYGAVWSVAAHGP